MMLEMRLCLALGYQSLKHFRECFPYDEIPLWGEYMRREGLPLQRLEAAIALSGAANCQVHGAKVSVKQLIPHFGEAKTLTGNEASVALKAWAVASKKNTKTKG
ncbi:hypothetical protein J8F10_19430 [Gemmata sp. G18]|uniref:Uncharacterized protein n=1 Tax=Gemmata palustris TaxID=2822762 RepID=A0ABS5BUT2_9BACT|nr:hypothetical protein [Gemmata palustris]MBP3957424.1 hypothetical protein [Gemmata palustris]